MPSEKEVAGPGVRLHVGLAVAGAAGDLGLRDAVAVAEVDTASLEGVALVMPHLGEPIVCSELAQRGEDRRLAGSVGLVAEHRDHHVDRVIGRSAELPAFGCAGADIADTDERER
jgi:hypothetical protein